MLPSRKIDQKLIFSHSRLPRHRRSRISCFPSLRTSVSSCRGAHPFRQASVRAGARGGRIFSLLAPSSLKSMQIFHEALSTARARARASAIRREKKKKKKKQLSRPATLSPPPPRRALFSFCRRCPTWRYVKRIYNWRYDGRALESNTSILIPATPTPRIQTIPPTRPCHFRGNPSNVKAYPDRSAFTVWILNLYRTVERTSEKYAGRDEQKRIFLGDRVALPLPIVFQLTILYFAISILHI